MPEQMRPTPEDAKIGEHPISSFNLNAHGQNPDFESPEAPVLEPTPELKAELENIHTIEDPQTGQKFGALQLNRGHEGRPLVSFMEYTVDAKHKGTNYQLEQLALQTDRPIWAIENPSTGSSDKLTAEQHEATGEGNFGPVAEAMVSAMKEQGLTEVDLEGHSLGARIAAAVAAKATEAGIHVKNLVLVEPAGFDVVKFREMVYRLGMVEGMKNMPEYGKLVQDPKGREAMDSTVDVIKNYAKMIRKDTSGNLWSYQKGLRTDTLYPDIIDALEADQSTKVHIISGGASEIAQRDSVNEAYDSLSAEFGDRVHLERLPGDTHMLNIGAQRRVAWHVSRLINN